MITVSQEVEKNDLVRITALLEVIVRELEMVED